MKRSVAAAAALVLAATAAGAAAAQGARPSRSGLVVTLSLSPSQAFFADPVHAEAKILVDRRLVDPDSVRASGAFTPFRQLAPPRRARSDGSLMTLLAYRFSLVCASEECLAEAGPRRVEIPSVSVVGATWEGRRIAVLARWPAAEIAPRVSLPPAAAPPWRAGLAPPPVSYRIDPDTLFVLLAAAAFALAALGVGLAAAEARRFDRLRSRRPDVSALEHALAAVRDARGREPELRRRAVGLLARALAGRDGELARAAHELAWSSDGPSRERVDALALAVERKVGRR